MKERLLLIAEDDESTIFTWQEDLGEFNANPDRTVTFRAEIVKDKRSAIALLERLHPDCAIVDLRLPSGDPNDGTGAATSLGNDILETLLLESGIPAVVYSGYTQEASPLVLGSQIKIIGKRGGGTTEALLWLADHGDLMEAMAATRLSIARESAKLFNRFIWPRWESGWRGNGNQRLLTEVITRQIVSHLSEGLGAPPRFHHPEEFYFAPALDPDHLGTGDMLNINGDVFVIVTPRCNMAKDTPRFLMLAACQSMGQQWTEIGAKVTDARKLESGLKELRRFATQAHATGTHFLPPFGGLGPWLVDFKEIETVASAQAPELLKQRFASICPSFVPNLIQRFSAYIGRIGQPDLDVEVLRSFFGK